MITFRKSVAVALLLGGAVATTGCSTMSLQDRTTTTLGTTVGGAVVGAGFGAGLGVGVAALLSSNPWTGALVGAGVGLLAGGAGGAIVGDSIADCQEGQTTNCRSNTMVTR